MEKNKQQRVGDAVRQLREKSGLSAGKQGCTACTGPADAAGDGVQRCKHSGKSGYLWETCKLPE